MAVDGIHSEMETATPQTLAEHGQQSPHQNVLAKALYDNSAEAPDELEFRKGDVITVIEQNTGGLEGWWLCSLNGRQGIAPGNRLKIMAGMFDTACMSNAPRKGSEGYTYDTLPSRKKVSVKPGQETYDVPPMRDPHPAAHLGYRTIPGARKQGTKDLKKGAPDHINIDGIKTDEIYDVPPNHGKISPSSPNSHGPTDHYDTLPKHSGDLKKDNYRSSMKKTSPPLPNLKIPPESSCFDNYEVPKAYNHPQDVYDVPPSHTRQESFEGDVYDIPKQYNHGGSLPSSPREKRDPITKKIISTGHKLITKTFSHDVYSVPPHSKGKQTTDYTYDVPPQVSRDRPADSEKAKPGGSIQDLEGKVSVLTLTKKPSFSGSEAGFTKVMSEKDDAAETLNKKLQALDSASSYLLSYVSSTWRLPENLNPKIFEIRAACNQLKLAGKEYLEFAEDIVANALQIHDDALFGKLSKLLGGLKIGYEGMERTASSMGDINWEAEKLCSGMENDEALLDSFVLSARNILDSARKFCTVVQENVSTLFRVGNVMQERPLPTPPSETGSLRGSTWVAAEKEGMVSKEPAQPLQVRPLPVPPEEDEGNTYEELPSTENEVTHRVGEQSEKIADYGYLSKDAHIIPLRQEDVLSEKDRQIIQFYATEVETLSNDITSAVELFFASVEGNQPPKVFVAHSKHVIILGHKLVFIGDTIHHNVLNLSVKQRIIVTNDVLCECLSSAVNSTKAAALQFPSVPPMQEMVDRITDVANATQDVRSIILDTVN